MSLSRGLLGLLEQARRASIALASSAGSALLDGRLGQSLGLVNADSGAGHDGFGRVPSASTTSFMSKAIEQGGIIAYPDIPYKGSLCLDVTVPSGQALAYPRPLLPVIIIIHGGAFRFGSRESRGVQSLAIRLAAAAAAAAEYSQAEDRHSSKYNLGTKAKIQRSSSNDQPTNCCISVAVSYSTGAPWPLPLRDVEDAIEWCSVNARRFGGDPDRLFVLGHSAGAYFAMHAGLRRKGQEKVRGIIGVSGVYDLKHAMTVPGLDKLLLEPLFGKQLDQQGNLLPPRVPQEALLVNSTKLFNSSVPSMLLVAEHELPTLCGDMVALWKSPRSAKMKMREIKSVDHWSIMDDQDSDTLAAILDFVNQVAPPCSTTPYSS